MDTSKVTRVEVINHVGVPGPNVGRDTEQFIQGHQIMTNDTDRVERSPSSDKGSITISGLAVTWTCECGHHNYLPGLDCGRCGKRCSRVEPPVVQGPASARDALAGLIGLVQLICGRPDMPQEIAADIQDNHRWHDAHSTLYALDSAPKMECRECAEKQAFINAAFKVYPNLDVGVESIFRAAGSAPKERRL